MTTPLQSPGQLLANLPGILGFYPHDSVVFVAFHQGATAQRFTLGPVLRIDLDDLPLLADVGAALAETNCDLVFAFVISQRGEDEVETVVTRLFEGAVSGTVDVQACWATRGILTGESYRLAFGPASTEEQDDAREAGDWGSGVVAPVAQAQAMTPLLEQGELPELTRQEAFDHFVRFNPQLPADDADQLAGFAHRYAADLVDVIRGERPPSIIGSAPGHPREVLQAVIDDLALLLDEVAEARSEGGRPAEELLGDEESLLTVAVLLSDSLLRDAILADVLERPGAAAAVFLAVSRTFGGMIRANALAYYALAAVRMKLSMRAVPALTAALQEVPGHALSALVLQSCRAGAFEEVLDAADRGSLLVRERYARTPEGDSGEDVGLVLRGDAA